MRWVLQKVCSLCLITCTSLGVVWRVSYLWLQDLFSLCYRNNCSLWSEYTPLVLFFWVLVRIALRISSLGSLPLHFPYFEHLSFNFLGECYWKNSWGNSYISCLLLSISCFAFWLRLETNLGSRFWSGNRTRFLLGRL